MKKIILIAILFVGGTTFAQENKAVIKSEPTSQQMKKKKERLEKMVEDFDLSPKQQAEINKLFEKQKQEWQSKNAQQTGHDKKDMTAEEREAWKAEKMASRKQFEEDLLKILTPEQAKIYHAKKEERMEKMKEKKAAHKESKRRDFHESKKSNEGTSSSKSEKKMDVNSKSQKIEKRTIEEK